MSRISFQKRDAVGGKKMQMPGGSPWGGSARCDFAPESPLPGAQNPLKFAYVRINSLMFAYVRAKSQNLPSPVKSNSIVLNRA